MVKWKVKVLGSLMKRILGKYMDNKPKMNMMHILSYAIPIYNSRPSVALGGLSPAQCMFWKDPKVPDVLDTGVASLSADKHLQTIKELVRMMKKVKPDLQATIGSKALQRAVER